jgi:hypothetical protein
MADAAPFQLVTRWAGQNGRLPAALRPGHVGLDERSAGDIVAETVHFGRFVRLPELNGTTNGDWEVLLTGDPSTVLTMIATLDVRGRTESVEALLADAFAEDEPQAKGRALRRLVSALLGLAADVERWIGYADTSAEASDLLLPLGDAIRDRLAPRLRGLIGLVAAAERVGLILDAVPQAAGQWAARWMVEEIAELELAAVEERLEGIAGEVHDLVADLAEIVAAARASISAAQPRDDHPPHLALVMAFADLFSTAQERLNALPRRMLDFYYRNVIGARPSPPRPDSVHLAFAQAGGRGPFTPVQVAPGTLFRAGHDASGNPIGFATDTPLLVTGARIGRMRLWRPLAGGLHAAEHPAEDGVIGFPPFEAPGLDAVVAGLIVASPLLALAGGDREVTLRIRLAEPVPVPALLRLAVTSAEGWREVDDAEARVVGSEALVRFLLAQDAAPLAACLPGTPDAPALPAIRLTLAEGQSAEAEAALFNARLLSVRLEVSVERLPGVTLQTVMGPASAAAGVEPFGPQPSPGSWFQVDHPAFAAGTVDRIALGLAWAGVPAGPEGFAGHYANYLVGPDRIVRRSQPLFTNASFRVDISGPLAAPPLRDVALFADAPGELPLPVTAADRMVPLTDPALLPTDWGPVSPKRWFALQADGSGPPAERGLLVTLTAPEAGFGDAVYPVNVAYATALAAGETGPRRRRRPSKRLAERLKGGLKGFLDSLLKPIRALLDWIVARPSQDELEQPEAVPARGAEHLSAQTGAFEALLPYPPWRPILSDIRVDMTAHAESGGGVSLFHLHPFDGLPPIEAGAGASLFPPLPRHPSFDLRIDDWPAGTPLALLLRLDAAPGDAEPGPIRWRWRTPGGWSDIELAPEDDGTRGLTATGILTLPAHHFPPGPIWLRAEVRGNGTGFPIVAALWPDALVATRTRTASKAPAEAIPAGTITSSPLRGLTVRQPAASFGGRAPEGEAALAARTSERLRHKDRAVLGWDMERLVLQAFPEIARVRTVPGRDAHGRDAPGALVLLVVPASDGFAAPDPSRPLAPAALRERIRRFVADRSSPFATIHVANPGFVEIDVSAAASFFEPGGAARLEADIKAFLSPWGGIGLEAAGADDADALPGLLGTFIRGLPYVAELDSVWAATASIPPGRPWLMPVAGAVAIADLAERRGPVR